jgi:hypothetical protein
MQRARRAIGNRRTRQPHARQSGFRTDAKPGRVVVGDPSVTAAVAQIALANPAFRRIGAAGRERVKPDPKE